MLPPGRRSATTVQHAPWKSMTRCACLCRLPRAAGMATQGARSEDVERFLVQRILVAVVGVVLHAFEVFDLDVLGDPAAAVGAQSAVGGPRNLDYAVGWLVGSGRAVPERPAHGDRQRGVVGKRC